MPRFNVEYNGKWACFSTITDDFITVFQDKADYEEWRKEEYGRANYRPAEKCNVYTIADAISSASLNNPKDKVVKNLIEAGLNESEAEYLWTKYNKEPDDEYEIEIGKEAEREAEEKDLKLERLFNQYISSLPTNYGEAILENPTFLSEVKELIKRVHENAYILGRYEGKQSYHLMQYKDEIEIIINDLGVVIAEGVLSTDNGNLLKKFNEVIRLLKEIREELK